MNISPINFNGRIAYDDEISAKRRNFIRERLNEDVFQGSDVFLQNPRLEEYELNQLIKKITKKEKFQKNEASKIDEEIMKTLPMYNIKPIKGTTSYKGGTIDLTDEICQKLKQAGVLEVISFLEYDFNDDICKRNGLDCFCYPVGFRFWDKSASFKSRQEVIKDAINSFYISGSGLEADKDKYVKDKIEAWEKDNRIFINNFINFINEMKKDNLYIGCACAFNRTYDMFALNHLFNPDAFETEPFNSVVHLNYDRIKNLYYNLTPIDKKKMGWDNSFDKSFLKRLDTGYKEFDAIWHGKHF